MKKVFLLLIFFLFFFSSKVYAFNPVPILMYHYIGNNPAPSDLLRNYLSVSPDKFEAQMLYLKVNGYTPITLDTLYSGRYPLKSVVLTFDDGYEDFYTNAYPVLRKYGFHAVAFIPTGLMNQGYYLTWNQIREMKNLISFEAHGVTHKSFLSLTPTALKSELDASKSILQSETGQIVNFVAYPNGLFNEITEKAVKKAGYVGGIGIAERIRINNGFVVSKLSAL